MKKYLDKGAEAITKKKKRSRTTHVQQKLLSSTSYKDECFSAIANCFRYCSSHLPFEKIRSEPLMQITHTVEAENEIKTLTMSHLKMFINAE